MVTENTGGWDYNCFPFLYMRYSVGGYGTHTPGFRSIEKYGGGSVDGCNEGNQYCCVCEPESSGEALSNFEVFPEPDWSSTWKEAQAYVETNIAKNSRFQSAESQLAWQGQRPLPWQQVDGQEQ
jgi:hypothetical protein